MHDRGPLRVSESLAIDASDAIDHADMPGLYHAARQLMRGEPIRVTIEQAHALISQFRETAAYRGWWLLAAAVMANHKHIVSGVLQITY